MIIKFEILYSFNPLTSPGKGVTVFTSPYLNAGAPALGEAKGLIGLFIFKILLFLLLLIFSLDNFIFD